MKIVTFERGGRESIGVLVGGGVVDIGDLLPGTCSQAMLVALIDGFDDHRRQIQARVESGASAAALTLDDIALRASVPAPGKVLCVMRNRPALDEMPRPYAYLKQVDGVGTGQVLQLPNGGEDIRHEPEVAAVVRGPARNVPRTAWRDAIFGYTGFLDVVGPSSAFTSGRAEDWWKSWSTPWAVGPCIVTRDAAPEPGRGLTLRVTTPSETVEVTDPGRPSLPELVEFLSSVMTLHSGDIIACGAHEAAVANANPGSRVELDIPAIGSLSVETMA